MRGCLAGRTASQAASMSFSLARARPQMIGGSAALPCLSMRGSCPTVSAICLHRLQIAGRGRRKARFDDVHAEARQLAGDIQLFLRVQRGPR